MNNFFMRVLTGTVYFVVFWGLFLWAQPIYFSALLGFFGCAILIDEWPHFCQHHRTYFCWLFLVYPLLPILALIYMNHLPQYHFILTIAFAVTFCYDTCAYAVGSLIGKHKLCSISPGKTWEGLIGGFIGALIGTYVLVHLHGTETPLFGPLVAGLLLCAGACLGDLFESWLKRLAHIKDSGRLLPGHGGLLDRLDGIFGAGICAWLLRDTLVRLLA